MAINTGVNASKALGYTVLANPKGADASKIVAYAVLDKPAGMNLDKLVAYAPLVSVSANVPSWGAVTFPDAIISNFYYQGWDLNPAALPTSFSIVGGALPPGFALTSVGGTDQGNISGVCTVLGAYTFTIRATNTYGTADKIVTINVNNPAPGTGGGGSYVFIG
jgi:hypothetical protein